MGRYSQPQPSEGGRRQGQLFSLYRSQKARISTQSSSLWGEAETNVVQLKRIHEHEDHSRIHEVDHSEPLQYRILQYSKPDRIRGGTHSSRGRRCSFLFLRTPAPGRCSQNTEKSFSCIRTEDAYFYLPCGN